MKENDWTKNICDWLRSEELGKNIHVDVLRRIPYAFEINSFIESEDPSEKWIIDGMDSTSFETDLVIYEKTGDKIVPRIIIEAKVEKVTTHDAITYSHKASNHKNVMPHIRYGIMIGNRGQYPLPGRLFRHGTNFDFLFSFVGYKPSSKEKEAFVEMIRKEIEYSRLHEEILTTSRSRSRKRYFMLQKEFVLKEMDDE